MANHKSPTVKIIAPRQSTAVPASGDRLYNFATDAINLAIGGFGAYTVTPDSGNHTAVNPANVQTPFKFIMRRDSARDRSPLLPREFEESMWIDSNCLYGTKISGTAARTGANNLHLVGSTNAINAFPTIGNFNFRLQASQRGDRSDLYNSVYNTPTWMGEYLSPDWSIVSPTSTDNQRRDIIVSGLAENFNRQSQGNVVAFVINSNGAAGAANGDTLANLANVALYPNGSRVIIGYTQEGNPVTLTIDKEIRRSLATLAAAAPVGARLRVYAMPNTNPAPAAVALAGALPGATIAGDHIALMSIDYPMAYYDYKMNRKSRITIGLREGLENVTQVEVQPVDEGSGSYHQIYSMYRGEIAQTSARNLEYGSYHVKYHDELLEDATYDVFVIEHCSHRESTAGFPSNTLFTTIIPLVSFQDNTTPYHTGAANPQKTYLQNVLNSFNTNANLGNAALNV